jgi:RNA polymerase sigma-70 factor (ECF subfamily)
MDEASRELVERAARGDGEAIGRLLRAHLAGLRAYVHLHMGPELRARESSADIVQDVLLEALQDLGRFEYRGEAAFKHWLYTRAEHRIVDRVRFHQRAKRDAEREEPAGRAEAERELLACYRTFLTPSHHASAREELERAERAFQKLPPDYREVILLARVVGLSPAEIAERTGRTRGAVNTLYSRALARLSSLLEEPQG